MRHKFKIDKSTKVFKIGELDDNNNINGFGMTYDHDNEKFFVGKFEDGKPTGIYCTNLFFKVKNKIKKCFMLKTNSTKKTFRFLWNAYFWWWD